MTTQHAFASYQEIIDLHTESDRVSILGFHTPSNATPTRLLRPFWDAFQKVRYRGCSMTLVPAARLPADPSQVSYEAGEQPIDPRDLLNPILFHGCHGNDMGTILNQFYSGENGSSNPANSEVERRFSDSMDHNMVKAPTSGADGNYAVFESLYYRALTDNTWLKAHPQRGFRKKMRPMVYNLATNVPFNPNSAANANRGGFVALSTNQNGSGVDNGIRSLAGNSTLGSGTTTNSSFQAVAAPGLQTGTVDTTTGKATVANPTTYSGQFFMSPSLRPLGFIDTRQWVKGTSGSFTYTVSGSGALSKEAIATNIDSMYQANDVYPCLIPKLFMGMCLLPPAYKTEQYFRIILNHSFEFAKYRGTSMRSSDFYAVAPNVVNMYDENGDTKGDFDGFEDKGILDD